MERHLFDSLWPVFGFGRYLGVFPCQRIKDSLTGKVRLLPINWKIQWASYVCTMVLSNAGVLINTMVLMANVKSFEDLKKCMVKDSEVDYNVMDSSSTMILTGLLFGTCFIVQWQTFQAKSKLCKLSNFAEGMLSRPHKGGKKILKPFLVVTILSFIFDFSSSLLYLYIHIDCFSLDWIWSVLIVSSQLISLIVFTYPIFLFLGLVLEIDLMVIQQSEKCKGQITDSTDPERYLNSVIDLVVYLERSRNMLSPNHFYVTSFLAIAIMMLLFIVISQIVLYFGKINTMFALVLLENGIFLVMLSVYLWYINIWSQKVTDEIHDLNDRLKKVFVQAGEMEFEKQIVSMPFMKSYVQDKLDEFQGFDGKGYFVLGKSFLKNLLTFIATYFVILLQFRLSQTPTSQVSDDNFNETLNVS